MHLDELLPVLRGRLYPTLALLGLAPALAANDSGDTGGPYSPTYLREDIACFKRGLLASCPPSADAAARLEGAEMEHGGTIEKGAGLDVCALEEVGAYAESGFNECCYVVTVECVNVVGCGCGGRPLRVARRVVRPPLLVGPRHAAKTDLDPTRRATLAAWWGGIGVSERASITSFRHFQRSLQHLGAPRALVRRAGRAMADEARHARLAFGLAGAYAGASMRAGRMPVAAAVPASLAEFAAETARDGGREELRSLVLLAAIAEEVREPAVAEVVEALVRDELEHVRLAWDTVDWAVDTGGVPVAEAVARALAEPGPSPSSWPDDPVLASHGLPRRVVLKRAFALTNELLRA